MLITRNDYALGVFNGDVGIVWDVETDDGREAMVVVVLPERDNDILSRELLYTAVTRAKQQVLIVGPEDVLRAAVARSARRGSGLAARLVAGRA